MLMIDILLSTGIVMNYIKHYNRVVYDVDS